MAQTQEGDRAPVAEKQHKALNKAARAALRKGTLPGTFRRLVTHAHVVRDGYRRVASRIERRDFVREHAPTTSRKRDVQPLPGGLGRDPWAEDPDTLPDRTRRLCTCPTCRGDKKVACPTCRGEARVSCPECRGRGKVQGQRGLKNCPGCRGRSTVKCKMCRRGSVDCSECQARGKVEAWLEIRTSHRTVVTAAPQSGVAALHRSLLDVSNFDSDPSTYRVPLRGDSGWVTDLPEIPEELRPQLLPREERIVEQRLQVFETEVYHFDYATRTAQGQVLVSGEPPAILPESRWQPLSRRIFLALAAGFVLFVAFAFILGAYANRATWFERYGNGGPMALCSLVASICGALFVAELWLPAIARRGRRVKLLGGIATATTALFAALWFSSGPDIAHVESLLADGDLEQAQHEVAALRQLGQESPRIQQAQEQLNRLTGERADARHRKQIESASDVTQAAHLLDDPWNTPEQREQAQRAVLDRARDTLESAYRAGDVAGLAATAAIASDLDPTLADRADFLLAVARARECLTARDYECAVARADEADSSPHGEIPEREEYTQLIKRQIITDMRAWLEQFTVPDAELTDRKAALEQAIAHAQLLSKFAAEKPSAQLARWRRQLRKVDKQLKREHAKAARAEKRRQAAEKRRIAAEERRAAAEERRRVRAEKRRAAKERRRARREAPLVCRDGSYSPTCTCGGSRRGCCSHHGGVAGCSM